MPKKVRSAAPKAKRAKRPMPAPMGPGRRPAPAAFRPYTAPIAAPGAAPLGPSAATRGRPPVVLDYSYVGPELRRIGMMAGAIFAILGILAVLLR
ncbi:MAG: hypothetical protein HYX92_10890 [Chloroflexi bacterium]|nr:hypothetical protein [Chloroflexota bacterium]